MKKILMNIIWSLLHITLLFPINNKKIIFLSHRGTQFSCNSKYMALYIKEHYGEEYKVIWCYANDEVKSTIREYGIYGCKLNGIRYIYEMVTSKYIVSNITLPRYIPFRKRQVKLNTWHGTPFKGFYNMEKFNYNIFDMMVSESKNATDVYRKKECFNYKNKVLEMGQPRNDCLIKTIDDQIDSIKNKLGIKRETRILLYAPTYRDNGSEDCFKIDFLKLQDILHEKFGGKWIVAFRYHHLQKNRPCIENSIDLSDYPDMQELMLISDVLISDYSSCMWDFSLSHKPCFIFATDINEMIKERSGDFFYPIDQLPYPLAENYKQLELNIKNFNEDDYENNLLTYFNNTGLYKLDGTATEKVVKELLSFKK